MNLITNAGVPMQATFARHATISNAYYLCHVNKINWRVWFVVLFAFFMWGNSANLHAEALQPVTTHYMTLSHHEFEPWDFVPKPGDVIEIANNSDIAHAIYITYPDDTVVNMGVQISGTIVRWTIPADAAGEYLLQCWIHPIIRARLMVKAPEALPSIEPASK